MISFALQPWHSAVEFQRHLRKYLEDIQSLNNLKTSNRTEYNLYESIIIPITTYLEHEGVNFCFNTEVTNLAVYPESDPTTVTGIELLEDGAEYWIRVDPTDIVIATLGSTTAGAGLGTNNSSPPDLSLNWEDRMVRDWRLWQKLAQISPKFGDPTNFLSQNLRSTIETFTTTFEGPEFMLLYEKLTHDRPGTGAMLSLSESNWSITLSIPHQPVFSGQSHNTNIICGYALSPINEGNHVKKPMYECCGEEILIEVLSYLKFPIEPIVATSKTIPCGMPLGTAPFLSRHHRNRPSVIPQHTSNIACVGQFVEIIDDTTLTMEYSVRGAQIAVTELMGLPRKPEKVRKSLLLEIFDLMI
jgi:oleate hydratase